jgi:hypothetical protein
MGKYYLNKSKTRKNRYKSKKNKKKNKRRTKKNNKGIKSRKYQKNKIMSGGHIDFIYAGETPILIDKENTGYRIFGLNTCLGIVAEIEEKGCDIVAYIAGHYNSEENSTMEGDILKLNTKGGKFIDDFNNLLDEYFKDREKDKFDVKIIAYYDPDGYTDKVGQTVKKDIIDNNFNLIKIMFLPELVLKKTPEGKGEIKEHIKKIVNKCWKCKGNHRPFNCPKKK